MQEKGLTVREDKAIALYELETRFAMATRQRELLENYIKERLKPGKHFYKVGDDSSRKPSLTKEGAELICLPHALKGHYQWLFGPENPPIDDTPYQITMSCQLEANGQFAGEGVGSASSYVTTKTGAHKPRQTDPGLRHNATVKMACKSAYIAATLNSTAASEFFTQDLEDDKTAEVVKTKPRESGDICPVHGVAWFKKGKMQKFAHPYEDEEGETRWCNKDDMLKQLREEARLVEAQEDVSSATLGGTREAVPPEPEHKPMTKGEFWKEAFRLTGATKQAQVLERLDDVSSLDDWLARGTLEDALAKLGE